MARLRNTLKVSVEPAMAWGVVGDLGAVDRWVPGVTSCQLDGSRRICNHGEIEEEISAYSPESKSYRYRHVKVPLPVKSSSGRLAVQTVDSGSLIVWDAEIEVLDQSREAEVLAMIDGYYKQALDSLRATIEGSNVGRALEVVNRLYDVTNGGVGAEAAVRELKDLVTEDVSFSGPLMEVRGAGQYLAVNQQFLPFHKETRMIKQFEDGEHVCSIYDFVVRTPAGEELTIPMVDWIRVSRGRVAEQRIYYDPREFAKAFGL